MTIGKLIEKHLNDNSISQRQFAKQCGLSNGYISMLINNTNPKTGKPIIPSISALLAISSGMSISLDELIASIDDMAVDISAAKMFTQRFDNIFPIEIKKYPLLGDIACGEPIFADEDRESYIVSGTDIKADFCLRCRGDSMIGARINDGDIVFIRSQPEVENGEIAAVIIGDEATLKRVNYFPEKNMLILKAENPKYTDLIYTDDELSGIRILGKAVAFQSDVR